YDADGVTATVILLKTLRQLGAHCDYYIPNRFTEGYGPNVQAFQQAFDNGFTVIITVDTGIAATDEATFAKQLGIDLIITDHHEVQEKLPEAYAIIHPKLSNNYSFKQLAGVGIAFKLAQYLLGYLPEQFLDLVALGTIADLVPLIDENRILTAHGLKKLATTTNLGLQALKRTCSLNDAIESDDVGFLLAPRINAVGRLQEASLAVDLLMAETMEQAEEMATIVQSINSERQRIVREIVKEAEAMIEADGLQNFIVVAKEGWNEGVLGIVASRLVQKYDRPAIVLTIQRENNLVKGSGRSIPAFDLFRQLLKISDLFTNFGGHSQAAGLSLPLENLPELIKKLNEFVNEQLDAEDFKQLIEISDVLTCEDISESLVHEINELAPFGMENPKPVFLYKQTPYDVRQIGQDKSHLKLQFQAGNQTFEGIGFGMGHLYPFLTRDTPLEIVGELNINEWNGHRMVQMVMQDIKIDDYQLFDHRGKRQLDLSPFIDERAKQLAVHTYSHQDDSLTIKQISYDDDALIHFDEIDDLFVFDLPKSLEDLKMIIQQTRPKNIHVCYHLDHSIYLTPFPTREDFKWLYGYINHYKTINPATHIPEIAHRKEWTDEVVQFMIHVFLDLQFIIEHHGSFILNPQPKKQALQQSSIYQQRLEQIDIEKKLYYSNAQDLKQWFLQMMDLHTVEEEVVNGL
ncbi:MAG TPA: single-stranded-DNA-specific exonuclease RecJ, partial [Bacillota bacterium]|nr:single-stranded-DNA-specific exonuclease RecJ [Bacillota bacterium]